MEEKGKILKAVEKVRNLTPKCWKIYSMQPDHHRKLVGSYWKLDASDCRVRKHTVPKFNDRFYVVITSVYIFGTFASRHLRFAISVVAI